MFIRFHSSRSIQFSSSIREIVLALISARGLRPRVTFTFSLNMFLQPSVCRTTSNVSSQRSTGSRYMLIETGSRGKKRCTPIDMCPERRGSAVCFSARNSFSEAWIVSGLTSSISKITCQGYFRRITVCLPLALAGVFFAEDLLTLIFETEYREATSAFATLCTAFAFQAAMIGINGLLSAHGTLRDS